MIRFAFGVVTEPYIPGPQADVIREARWHLAGYALIAALSVATAKLGGAASSGCCRCWR
jgi:hypothetical protein